MWLLRDRGLRMKKTKRIEITAFRRQISVHSGHSISHHHDDRFRDSELSLNDHETVPSDVTDAEELRILIQSAACTRTQSWAAETQNPFRAHFFGSAIRKLGIGQLTTRLHGLLRRLNRRSTVSLVKRNKDSDR